MIEDGHPDRSAPATDLARYVDAGDWDQALPLAVQVAASDGPLPARTAWRAVMMLYLHADLDACAALLAPAPVAGADPHGADPHGADPDPARDSADRALLAAWSAAVRWARGDIAAGRGDADRSLELARTSGHPRALAAAHTVLALLAATDGDRRANDRHYGLALQAAIRAGDTTQHLRIRTNRGCRRMEEGDLDGALAELDAALAVAAAYDGVHPAYLGMAQCNRAETLLRSGRLDAARDGFRTACLTLQRAGTHLVAYAVSGLGECYELRGDLLQARAAFEEAVHVAEAARFNPAAVPALAGLARVLAATGDPDARSVADRAVDAAIGLTEAAALTAAGWAALAAGDTATAHAHAVTATASARAHRNAAVMAEGLELAAMSTAEPGTVDALLADAARLWADLGNPVAGARVQLARARAAGPAGTASAILAEHRLRRLDVDPAGGTRSLSRQAPPPAPAVRVLGSFAVLRGGEPLPTAAWQSRKARELLKLLIVRRGRPITREALGEALWPGEPSVANRLSVTLSVLRAVLDPDRVFAADHYVVADTAGVGYNPTTLSTDVDVFLCLAADARAAARSGTPDEAQILLEAAEAAYTGDILDDEPGSEAVQALCDEARSTYLAVTRRLGQHCADSGDVDGAVRAWLRLLHRDPYDEDCALRLIALLHANGRHGEATRQYRRYAERMRSLKVPVAPMPTAGATGR